MTEPLQEISDAMRWVIPLLAFIGGSIFAFVLALVLKQGDS